MKIALTNFTRRAGTLLASAALVFMTVFVFSSGAAAAASVRTQQKKAAAPAAVAAKTPVQVQAKAVAAKPAESAAKGMNTGITVHGHWVINVLTPGGKLVSHTEFENSLQSGGMLTLAQVLGQQQAVGPWVISLAGTSAVAECSVLYVPGTTNQDDCLLVQGLNASAGVNDCNLHGIGCAAGMPAPVVRGNTLQFTGGSVLLNNAAQITQVETVVVLCGNTISPSACASSSASVLGAGGEIFTIGAPPAPVNVGANQIVQVTVTFSFS